MASNDTSELSEKYFSVTELMAMDVEELQSLWEGLTPERQQFYENAYDTALSSVGEGDITDDAAMGVIEQVLSHYESGQVPIVTGNRWVQVPAWVRERMQAGESVAAISDQIEVQAEEQEKPTGAAVPIGTRIRRWAPIVGLILVAFCLIFFIMSRFLGGSDGDDEATLVAEGDLTPTAEPTATALAITNTDRIIRDGDDFQDYFPRILEIQRAGSTDSRVYVVQPKEIAISDWAYDSRSPEIASWITGLLVRPVLGIPFSEENDAFIKGLVPGDTIMLHMSTGTVLHFDIENSAQVNPQDTSIFRQFSPGIAIVLLGDVESVTRYVVFGSYPPDQELIRDDGSLSLGNPSAIKRTGETTDLADIGATITVLNSYASVGGEGELPDNLAYLFVDIELQAGAVDVSSNGLQFELVDAGGSRYSPVSFNPTLTTYTPLIGQVIPAGTALQGSVGYLVPRTIASSATMNIRTDPLESPVTYLLSYEAPGQLTPRPLEVVVTNINVVRNEGGINELVVVARIFNPNEQALSFSQDDIYAVFSPNDPGDRFPVGPQIFPSTINGTNIVTQDVSAGQAYEIEARFQWDGSSYIGVYIAGYEYLAEVVP